MLRSYCLLVAPLLTAAVFTSPTLAQELPTPEPTEAHKVLKMDEGTWKCEAKMYFAGPTEPPTICKGTEVNQLVSGDLFAKTEFTLQIGDRKFEGHALMGYDPRSKEYVGTWVDNFSTVPTPVVGKYDPETKTMTAESTVRGEDGETVKQRQVTKWLDENKKTFTIYYLMEVGGEVQPIKVMDMTATREKK